MCRAFLSRSLQTCEVGTASTPALTGPLEMAGQLQKQGRIVPHRTIANADHHADVGAGALAVDVGVWFLDQTGLLLYNVRYWTAHAAVLCPDGIVHELRVCLLRWGRSGWPRHPRTGRRGARARIL